MSATVRATERTGRRDEIVRTLHAVAVGVGLGLALLAGARHPPAQHRGDHTEHADRNGRPG